MKAWNNDWRPDRWVKQIHKHRLPYLRAYAPPRPAAYEGKVIQAKVRARQAGGVFLCTACTTVIAAS